MFLAVRDKKNQHVATVTTVKNFCQDIPEVTFTTMGWTTQKHNACTLTLLALHKCYNLYNMTDTRDQKSHHVVFIDEIKSHLP